MVRATKDASAPRASETGLNGWSTEPTGVDLVILPGSEVGQEALDRGEDRVVTATGAPAHLLVGGVLLAVLRLVLGRYAGQAREGQLLRRHWTVSFVPVPASCACTSPVVPNHSVAVIRSV